MQRHRKIILLGCVTALMCVGGGCTLDADGTGKAQVASPDGGQAGGGGAGSTSCDSPGDFVDPASQHCYRHVEEKQTWNEARDACVKLGGDLAAISTPSEHTFLDTKLDIDVWIGGTDIGGECSFSWTNGEPWAPFWAGGEPNNANGNEDCAYLLADGKFNDSDCATPRDYLCERTPAGGCGDGIVQSNEECDDANPPPNVTCNQCKIQCNANEFKDPTDLHCYELMIGSKDWSEARDDCAARGTILAVITSDRELGFLQPHLMGDTWLYSQKDSSNWVWRNTEQWCYQNWAPGEPNSSSSEVCLEMYATGQWNNEQCYENGHHLCERAPLGNVPLPP